MVISCNYMKVESINIADCSFVSDKHCLLLESLLARGKSLLEFWVTTFLPDCQAALIFVKFISNFLCMCSNSMASAHLVLK